MFLARKIHPAATPTTMRSRQLLTTSLSILATTLSSTSIIAPASALPFRTRGSSTTTGDNVEAITDANGETIDIVFPDGGDSKTPRRNAVVEAFFENGKNTHSSQQLKDEISNQASNLTEFLQSTRRTLHMRPELMYQEKETSQIVQSVLSKLGISYTTGWSVNTHPDVIKGPGGYGVVADIGTGGQPCVLLRADMDALPIFERTEGVDQFKSRSPDRMHACGHDGHT